ncbi:MAG TPA: polysaccharide deacetylase family protein [Longimicrobiales bacterium]|mgnify:CR=1 FL=1|nr:polysaccharide deacetylase family protein [Longimicrobiales bacterium]
MNTGPYITTSWDDGHPLDLRVADLLTRYGLRGTFYVPRTAPGGTMTRAQLRELADAFEIGAHTLHHVVLTRVDDARARAEITGSRAWVEDVTGAACTMFCPPMGRFSLTHVLMMGDAGYTGFRTVELLSTAPPRPVAGMLELGTTIQAHPHRADNYIRNAIRRRAPGKLVRWAVHAAGREWPAHAESLLRHVLRTGGVFHLWGHSWEVEQNGQWAELERVLERIGALLAYARPVTNGELCTACCAGAPEDERVSPAR